MLIWLGIFPQSASGSKKRCSQQSKRYGDTVYKHGESEHALVAAS